MHIHTHTLTHTHTHTHLRATGLKKGFWKENSFQEHLERTVRGSMTDRNRELLPGSWSNCRTNQPCEVLLHLVREDPVGNSLALDHFSSQQLVHEDHHHLKQSNSLHIVTSTSAQRHPKPPNLFTPLKGHLKKLSMQSFPHPHSKPCFLHPFSKLSCAWSCHWRGT